ncbi:cold shock domain-containing protein [Streptomyces bacillaris]|uniref:cold shock domain-containing protein n=1 Tax=Streptomyces bacillaris TaxID=68179 RepID=UPI003467E54E
MSERLSGTCSQFSEAKGFGFIAPSSGGEKLYVHYSDIMDGRRSLAEGESVVFSVSEDANGTKKAVQVVGNGDGVPASGKPSRISAPWEGGEAAPGGGYGSGSYGSR